MTTTDSTWFQETAFDLLQRETMKTKTFADALVVYRTLITLAADTDSEVTPTHAGKWFQVNMARIALRSNQKLWDVQRRMADLLRLGLVEKFREIPPDGLTPFELRLCTIKEQEAARE